MKWSYCLLKFKKKSFLWNLLFHALVNYLKNASECTILNVSEKKFQGGGLGSPPQFYHVATSNFNSGCSIQSYWIPWECHSWTSPGRTYVDLWFCCHQVWGISSCNNVKLVSRQSYNAVPFVTMEQKKSCSWNIKTHYLRFKHFIITITDDPSPC